MSMRRGRWTWRDDNSDVQFGGGRSDGLDVAGLLKIVGGGGLGWWTQVNDSTSRRFLRHARLARERRHGLGVCLRVPVATALINTGKLVSISLGSAYTARARW